MSIALQNTDCQCLHRPYAALTSRLKVASLLSVILLFTTALAHSQKLFGNEWINDSQTYIRLSVSQNGWYRLSAGQIQTAGADLRQIAPNTVQIFHRGQEIPLYTNTRLGISLQAEDYIEFYGKKNDGVPDSSLYVTPDQQPHPYYSLYSDTSAYFLTWRRDGLPGKRINQVPSATGNETAVYHISDQIKLLTSQYPAGNIYPMGAGYDNGTILTTYDTGEGWTGPERRTGEWETQTFSLEKPYLQSNDHFRFDILLTGRNAGLHKAEIWSGKPDALIRKIGEIEWIDYNSIKFSSPLLISDRVGSEVHISVVPKIPGEAISLSYLRYQYPQEIFMESSQKEFKPTENTFLSLDHSLRLFDLSAGCNQIIPGDPGLFAVQKDHRILAVMEPLSIQRLQLVRFEPLLPTNIDYLIISHPTLRNVTETGIDAVADYAAYRASPSGGNYKPLVLNAQEIFDRFNYGEPGPLGIHRAIEWLSTKGKLKFLFIIGKSIDPQTARHHPDPRSLDMIPNAGWPGSDMPLGMSSALPGTPVSMIAVGRLNTNSSIDVVRYLAKVKLHESVPVAEPWRKQVLHLSGGRTSGEVSSFRNYVNGFEKKWINSIVGADVQTLSKRTTDPIEQFPIAPLINDGVALMTLFGHSSLDVTDIDIGRATDVSRGYYNKGRFPAVLVNGCALGNIYYGPMTLSNDWILAPETGSVSFIAHTYNGLVSEMRTYTDQFYEVIGDLSFTSSPLGIIQKETINRYLKKNATVFSIATAQQMNLQGDPAIVLFPATKPDYAWVPGSISFADQYGDPLQPDSDTLRISVTATNHGRFRKGNLKVRFVRKIQQTILKEAITELEAFPTRDTLYWLIPNDKKLLESESWEFTIDSELQIDEENEANNILHYNPEIIFPELPDKIAPLLEVKIDGRTITDGEVVMPQPNIRIRVIDENLKQLRSDTTGIILHLRQDCTNCSFQKMSMATATWNSEPSHDFSLTLLLPRVLTTGDYELKVEAADLSGNRAPDYLIRFKVRETQKITKWSVSPNPADYYVRMALDLEGNTAPASWKIVISDIAGRKITTLEMPPHIGRNELLWKPEGLAPGVYLYQMTLSDSQGKAILPDPKKQSGKIVWVPY